MTVDEETREMAEALRQFTIAPGAGIPRDADEVGDDEHLRARLRRIEEEQARHAESIADADRRGRRNDWRWNSALLAGGVLGGFLLSLALAGVRPWLPQPQPAAYQPAPQTAPHGAQGAPSGVPVAGAPFHQQRSAALHAAECGVRISAALASYPTTTTDTTYWRRDGRPRISGLERHMGLPAGELRCSEETVALVWRVYQGRL